MAGLVFGIAAFNLALGYALAVYLRRCGDAWPDGSDDSRPSELSPDAISSSTATRDIYDVGNENQVDVGVKEPPLAAAEIPERWLEELRAAGVRVESFVEASSQFLQLQVGKYRETLLQIEEELRHRLRSAGPTGVEDLRDRLKAINVKWLATQRDALQQLSSFDGNLGPYEKLGRQLVPLVQQQIEELDTSALMIDSLDFANSAPGAATRLLQEFSHLLKLAHRLRDRSMDMIVDILRCEDRLAKVDSDLQQDKLTGLPNRAGFHLLLEQWWSDDPAHQRTASAAIIGVDFFENINQQHGGRVGDRVLGSVGQLLSDLIHRDRGFERAARIDGTRFVLFFGDTGPRHATSSVERIRQTVEDSIFEISQRQVRLGITSVVTEVCADDDSGRLEQRMLRMLSEARINGSNLTMLDEGDGPKPVDPPRFKVEGRAITIET